MTNEELKKKICDIIAPYVSAYGDDERIADALIAVGIGFMDDDITSKIVATIKRDTEPITMENVALRKQVAEAEHRAEVAEQALKLAEKLGELCAPAKDYIKQAEKELQEEKKSD